MEIGEDKLMENGDEAQLVAGEVSRSAYNRLTPDEPSAPSIVYLDPSRMCSGSQPPSL